MKSIGIILIHGYTGSDQDLKPLASELSLNFGNDSVKNISLPGHGPDIPVFNDDLFVETITNSINIFKIENRKIIIIGHSTGGNFAIRALYKFSIIPDLLILISVPKKIDSGYLSRWNSHRSGKHEVPFIDIAMMIKFINSTGLIKFSAGFPVLIIHGDNDKLVPVKDSCSWKKENFTKSARIVIIPDAGHDDICSKRGILLADIITRAITDILNKSNKDKRIVNSLIEIEPEIKDFVTETPSGESHLALCPGAGRAIGEKPELSPAVINDPVIANIEITTYCNLKCKYCARSQFKRKNKHMPFGFFRNILALMPDIYRITLVGLGEPLMHPQIADFIRYAKSLKKKTAVVTNAMLLDTEISRKLLDAGLDSITFSIDWFDRRSASLVRKGTDFNRVINNIKEFVNISKSIKNISKSVFSAVSVKNVPFLKNLIDLVSGLGMDVIMLSDINFKSNLDHSVWKNIDDNIEMTVRSAVSRAFSKKFPVLSVHGLEEFGLEKRYQEFLLIPPGQLYRRSVEHTWCLSPWQTIPVDVDGNITICDCQPDPVIGNLFRDPFTGIWNGNIMKKYRALMLSGNPPDACRICPRF